MRTDYRDTWHGATFNPTLLRASIERPLLLATGEDERGGKLRVRGLAEPTVSQLWFYVAILSSGFIAPPVSNDV